MYKIVDSQFIIDNHAELEYTATHICEQYMSFLSQDEYAGTFSKGGGDYTENHDTYNIWSLLRDFKIWQPVYEEVTDTIKSCYDGPSDYLYLKSWINYSEGKELLDWHGHGSMLHGYVSITPHKTTTEFERFEVENKIGRIYVGPGIYLHRVNIVKPFSGKRITIGFDVYDNLDHSRRPLNTIPIRVQ